VWLRSNKQNSFNHQLKIELTEQESKLKIVFITYRKLWIIVVDLFPFDRAKNFNTICCPYPKAKTAKNEIAKKYFSVIVMIESLKFAEKLYLWSSVSVEDEEKELKVN